MTSNGAEDTSEIVWGAAAIAKAIDLKDTQKAFYKLRKGLIPGARKVGDTWALDLKVWRAAFREPEAA